MLRLSTRICGRMSLSNCLKKATGDECKVENLSLVTKEFVRNTSFFNKINADMLWKGVLSVSNPGRKRGRAKSRRPKVNLNAGQYIGAGKEGIIWPGLNTEVVKGGRLVEISKSDKVYERPKQEITKKKRSITVHPLERGWSGAWEKGRKIGPPDPIGEETFENFESIVIEHKITTIMTGLLGRSRQFKAIVLTGNKNGLIGVGKCKALESRLAIKKAKNLAVKRLIVIDLINKESVNHDFFSQFGSTKIFVCKKPPGFGLKCHRVLTACCELIGIKDMYAKIEGPMNVQNIIKAFLIGLLQQKTYQQIADEKKLHLVEFKKEQHYFPNVLASPEVCLTPQEFRKNPVNFEEYIMGDRLVYRKPKKLPFYTRLPSWTTYLKRTLYKRNHDKVKIDLLAEYGKLQSFLAERYIECGVDNKNKRIKYRSSVIVSLVGTLMEVYGVMVKATDYETCSEFKILLLYPVIPKSGQRQH